jgi:RHS repeat-associated protein
VNKYYQIPGGASGVSNYYDTNGNLKNDQTNTYTWDADGNMLSTNGSTAVTMIYDAMDRMIEQTRSSAHAEIVYGPYGLKMALMSGQTLVNAFVKLPGGARAVYNSSGLAYYRHGDHLGSSRLATTPSRAKYYDVAYAPYGEDYNGSGTTPDLAFTDQNQDTVGGGWGANLYDFMLREYRTGHGRWTSPDPAGLGAVDPTNPQTWNRYAYVLNNPLAMVDLLGDDGCYDSTGQDLGVAEVNCYSAGGVWLGGGQWVGTDGNVYGPPQLVTTQVTPTIVGIPTAPGAPGTYWWTPNFGPFFNLYGFQLITNTFQAPNFPAPSPGSPGGPAAGGGGKPGSVPSGAPPSPKPRTPWQTFIHPTPADCRRVNITAKAEFVFAAGAGATGFLAPVTAPVAEPAALGSTLSGALGEMYMAIVCN